MEELNLSDRLRLIAGLIKKEVKWQISVPITDICQSFL